MHLSVSTAFVTLIRGKESNITVGCIVDSFFGWHTGMALCSAPHESLVTEIVDIIRSLAVTHLHLTPTLASRLNQASIPSVQCVITTGERPVVKVHRDWAMKGLHQGIYDLLDAEISLNDSRLILVQLRL